jgi:hypothetical protein
MDALTRHAIAFPGLILALLAPAWAHAQTRPFESTADPSAGDLPPLL